MIWWLDACSFFQGIQGVQARVQTKRNLCRLGAVNVRPEKFLDRCLNSVEFHISSPELPHVAESRCVK